MQLAELAELPAEALAIVARAGRRGVVAALLSVALAVVGLVVAGVFVGVAVTFDGMAWRHPGYCFATSHPLTWVLVSGALAIAWANGVSGPLAAAALGENDPSPGTEFMLAHAGPKLPGLAVFSLPLIALWLSPIPDVFPTRSLEYPWEPPASVVACGLVAFLGVSAAVSGYLGLAPFVYVREREATLLGTLRGSRNLARGHFVLVAVATLVPALLGACALAWMYPAGEGTLGREIVGRAMSEKLSAMVGVACLAVTPSVSAVLKGAAFGIISRRGARGEEESGPAMDQAPTQGAGS